MKPLPIGIQTFADIRNNGFVYVDKTAHLVRLASPGKGYYFLSRPRRFGKSVLISTLESFFQGKRHLFEGLAVAGSDYAFPTHPVLRLDFSAIPHANAEALEQAISNKLVSLSRENGLPVDSGEPVETLFERLLLKLGEHHQVVILVDEYDKPIIEHVTNPEMAEANRKVLRRFYSVMKSLDRVIRFVFITGITKFARVSIFSDLNNLEDLSLDDETAAIVGWTEEELDTYFSEHIAAFASTTGFKAKEIRKELRVMYNGYRFSESDETVYNPWSILNALKKKKLRNFWYTSGSPNFLMEILHKRLAEPSFFKIKDLYDYKVRADMPLSFNLDRLDLVTLFFQTGYLTIKYTSGQLTNTFLHLGFPNREVEQSLLITTLESFSPAVGDRSDNQLDKLVKALEATDLERFFEILGTSFFANIPYKLHIPQERYYQTLFHTIFLLLNIRIRAEETTNIGHMDHVIELPEKIFIFEFKYEDSAEVAIQQIRDKQYDQKFAESGKTIYRVGVGFSNKNISGWLAETADK